MDGGAEKPLGMGYGSFGPSRRPAPPAAGAASTPPSEPPPAPLTAEEQQSIGVMQDITALLAPIGADSLALAGGGSDIGPLTADAVPSLSPHTVGEHYFDWHHTEADTLDKVDPDSFRKNIGMLSVVAFVVADMDGRLVGRVSAARE